MPQSGSNWWWGVGRQLGPLWGGMRGRASTGELCISTAHQNVFNNNNQLHGPRVRQKMSTVDRRSFTYLNRPREFDRACRCRSNTGVNDKVQHLFTIDL